jgi:hypothetical protein
MAQCIVDLFEIVQTEIEYGYTGGVTISEGDLLIEAGTQKPTIRQLRQRIVVGHEGQFFFGQLVSEGVAAFFNSLLERISRLTNPGYDR